MSKPRDERWTCSDCGCEITRAGGGSIFTVCDKCWNEDKDPHFNAHQRAMQAAQGRIEKLNAAWVKEADETADRQLVLSTEASRYDARVIQQLQAEVVELKGELELLILNADARTQQLADQQAEIERLKKDNGDYAGQHILIVQRVEAISQRCDSQHTVIDGLVGALQQAMPVLLEHDWKHNTTLALQANAALAATGELK